MTACHAVCWDMDGSLIDNHAPFEQAISLTNAKYQLTYVQEYAEGGCFETLWSCLHNPHKISFDLWQNEIIDFCLGQLSKSSLRPYVEEILGLFKAQEIPQSCVSNSPSTVIETNLSKTQIVDYFSHWVGRDHVKVGKPSPDPYLHSCVLHQVKPEQCLAIEDSKVGIQSAKAAGLTVIAFPHGHSRLEDLALADYVFSDLREVKSLERIFSSL